MNEKPQTAREDESEDLLEQIITQGLEKMKTSAQVTAVGEAPAEAAGDAPAQKDSGGTAPAADKKNKRSAVYLYLLILFGAAFMMLLLAYFIQQRNSESTISDLKDSMNLSREELLSQIKDLEGQNSALDEKVDQLQSDLTQLQQLYEERAQEATDNWDLYNEVWKELNSWNSFWALEQYYQEGDYESCAAILLLQKQNPPFPYHAPKGTEDRQTEIVHAVIDEGILDDDYEQHLDDYNDLLDAHYSDVLDRLSESGMALGWIK